MTPTTSCASPGGPVWRQSLADRSSLQAVDEEHCRVLSVGTSSTKEGMPWLVLQGQRSVARYAADLRDMVFFYGWRLYSFVFIAVYSITSLFLYYQALTIRERLVHFERLNLFHDQSVLCKCCRLRYAATFVSKSTAVFYVPFFKNTFKWWRRAR